VIQSQRKFGEAIMASSIYGDESRCGEGWHDRRAGTVVVKAVGSGLSIF
jgi:hypothetical protein